MKKNIFTMLAVAMFGMFALAACEDDRTTAEKIGDNVEEAGEEINDEIDDATTN